MANLPSLQIGSSVDAGENISTRAAQHTSHLIDFHWPRRENFLCHSTKVGNTRQSLGPVDLNVSGSYRCYGWYNRSPYLWSFPSNALELVVTDSINRDYTTQNLIRMAMAGLVLVALLAILVENWHSHKALNKEASADVAEPSWSHQMCQPGWTFARTPSVCK
uniref:Fc fragment of IgA receptor n=1 Tax=Macaca fascicularis TaxID=9541 RepID=A0A7N9ID89_MACFA